MSQVTNEVFFQKFLTKHIPQDIVEEVFTFSGPPKAHKEYFQNMVLPDLILIATYREIVYKSIHNYIQLQKFTYELVSYQYTRAVQVYYYDQLVIQLNIVTNMNILHNWNHRLFWENFSWEGVDDAIEFIIRHFIWNIPLPGWEGEEEYFENFDELIWG